MNNEIFRFAVIRSPKQASVQKTEVQTIKIIELASRPLEYHNKLIQHIANSDPRLTIARSAESYLKNNGIDTKFSGFDTPILAFDRWVNSQINPIDSMILASNVARIFGQDFPKVVSSTSFMNDLHKALDGTIATSSLITDIDPIRSVLLRVIREFYLLLAFSKNRIPKGDFAINDILNYTILLPGDIFPLPLINDERKQRVEEIRKEQKKEEERRRKSIADAKLKIQSNSSAIDELMQVHLSFISSREIDPPELVEANDQGNSNTKRVYNGFIQRSLRAIGILPEKKVTEEIIDHTKIGKSSVDYLPQQNVDGISPATKEVLQKINIKAEKIHVPDVVSILENDNRDITNTFYNSAATNGSWAHNYNWVTTDEYVEVDEIQTPGPCPSNVTTPPVVDNNGLVPDTFGKVHKIGVAELMIVRQELVEYKALEIAHIENVLQGELKQRKHKKKESTEESIFSETETENNLEVDLQTSELSELQKETSQTISDDSHFDAGGTISGSWGTIEATAYGNYASNHSEVNSKDKAENYAKDVVSRSVQQIKERVLESRSRISIREVEEVNKHTINNEDGTGNISGIYRWVNKIYEAQIVNYGKRIILEFTLPEPSAFYKHALGAKSMDSLGIVKPKLPGQCVEGKFKPLQPEDITGERYQYWAGEYGVLDIAPPPTRYKKVNFNFMFEKKQVEVFGNSNGARKEEHLMQQNHTLNLPAGYVAIHAKMKFNGRLTGRWYIDIIVGNKQLQNGYISSGYVGRNLDTFLTKQENTVPFVLYAYNAATLGLEVEIQCIRSEELFTQWQLNTFNAIMAAYNELLSEFEEEVNASKIQEGISIQGRNPQVNREIERTELRKLAIAQLTGQNYELFNSVSPLNDPIFNYPEVDLSSDDAFEEGKYIQFFESALEWRLMTYLFYPYYWSNKGLWGQNLQIEDNDPLFEKFLQAGAAKIQVPVRKGFESAFIEYIDSGVMVGERDEDALVDGENKEFFISMLDEIKEELNNDYIERPGLISVTKDSKVVVGDNTDFKSEDVNREILINLKTYRIAKFLSNTQIELNKRYEDNTDTGIGYATGVKLVGEPWLVEIPTRLVYLQDSSQLNPESV